MLNSLTDGNIRYRLQFGNDKFLEFSAPECTTQMELANILNGIANILNCKRKRIVGECFECSSFIYENEQHVCK